jgi:PilZ domain
MFGGMSNRFEPAVVESALGIDRWANGLLSVIGVDADDEEGARDRRREFRRDFCGHKVIIRQRRNLGILHLKNVSRGGACGITDMPVAVGSMVFLELKKPHFYAAEVLWVRSLTIGLQLVRPVKGEMLEKLHAIYLADREEREAREAAL